MINLNNVNGVVQRALRPSPLAQAVQGEMTRRKIKTREKEIKEARRAAQQAKQQKAAAKQQPSQANPPAPQPANGSGTPASPTSGQQLPLFPHPGPQQLPLFNVPAGRQAAPQPAAPTPPAKPSGWTQPGLFPDPRPQQLSMFDAQLRPPSAPAEGSHQLGLFPEPVRQPTQTPQTSEWTQGGLFADHEQGHSGVPQAPKFSQGTLFSEQLQPHTFTSLPANPRAAQYGLFKQPAKQPRPQQQAPATAAPVKRQGTQIPLFNNQLKPYAQAKVDSPLENRAPVPGSVSQLADSAKGLGNAGWPLRARSYKFQAPPQP